MKMKEFGPPGGARVPGNPPLDPPMNRSLFAIATSPGGSFTIIFFQSLFFQIDFNKI